MIIERFPNERPCTLAPPEAFGKEFAPEGLYARLYPDMDPARTGPESNTVNLVFESNCAGAVWRPDARLLYDGLAADTPTERQLNAIETWLLEATIEQTDRAWIERAYTWRGLVRAMHNTDLPIYEKWRVVNCFAENQSLVPDDSLPVP